MSTPQFIAARDGTRLRYQIFDAAEGTSPRGVCVLLTGQTEFIEKYGEVTGELCARGFKVAALDWRGQGGSQRLLPEPLKAHVADFRDYDDDLSSFMSKVVMQIADRPPLALAHSMGGHILLRALHENPGSFAGAVLSAPMLRAQTRGYPRWLARFASLSQNLAGQKAGWVWGMDKRDPISMPFEMNLVTTDRERFARTQKIIAGNPALRLSGPTWGWLEAAYRSMAKVMAPGFAEAIATPVLLIGAGHDRIVDVNAAREFAPRLPHGTYLELACEHEMLMENDAVRAQFWKAFDGFAARVAR